MPVADLARVTARRYVDTFPLTDLARDLLKRSGVPTWAAFPPFVDDLARVLRGVLEAALVEHLTIPQLAALARFYATPEGAAVMSKLLAFNDAVTPALEAAVGVWARELAARLRALSSSDALRPKEESQ